MDARADTTPRAVAIMVAVLVVRGGCIYGRKICAIFVSMGVEMGGVVMVGAVVVKVPDVHDNS